MRNKLLTLALPYALLFAVQGTGKGNHIQDSTSSICPRDTLQLTAKELFIRYCYGCHKDSIGSQAPATSVLASLTPRAIYMALNSGKMRTQALALTLQERKAVAEWLTHSSMEETALPSTAYTSFSLPKISSPYDQCGWGNNLEGTGFRTAEQGGINIANVKQLHLKWAFAFPQGTIIRSKPAVVGDYLVVGSQFGEVYVLNRYSGKIAGRYAADAAIRGAISVAKENGSLTAYFADYATNVYALDLAKMKLRWRTRAGFDPGSSVTGSVVVYHSRVYVPVSSTEVGSAADGHYPCCSSSGGVVALDCRSGKILWTYRVLPKAHSSGTRKDGKPYYGPSGAPVWCSPTIDVRRNCLYIGTGENYSLPTTTTCDAVQALDLTTGRLRWSFQATANDAYNLACPFFANCPPRQGGDLDFGMAPILVKGKDGQDVLVAGQKAGVVFGLTPHGKLLWKTRVGKGGMLGGVHWGMATDGVYVFAANADNEIALDRTDSAILPAPGLYALDLHTGNVVWKAPAPVTNNQKIAMNYNSAAPLAVPKLVFSGTVDGHIRAYDAKTGSILWDYNTVRDYETTDGLKGKGGSIDGPAPVAASGMLYVNSGYGMFSQAPGNVLLAFSVR